MYDAGQGICGKIQFIDGCFPKYPRTYLIVDVSDDTIKIVNVSSTEGKEHKLLFPDNLPLENYKPPFIKPSFVKLDSIQEISFTIADKCSVLHKGEKLYETDLNKILNRLGIGK